MQTHIVLIVDKSGSMSNVTDDTIGGFNTYLKELDDEVLVSAMLFDTEFKVLFQDSTPKRAKRLNGKNYRPSGNTALLDAVGKTLTELEFPKGDKVLCVIQTDGHENSSKEFNYEMVKLLIKTREADGWDFLYMGADQSAWSASSSLGIAGAQTIMAPQGTSMDVKIYYSKLAAASNSWNYASQPATFGMDMHGRTFSSPVVAAAVAYDEKELEENKNAWKK